MHFDYGYMEDRQLGKPYNIGLLKRLLPYARNYWKPICIALVLTLAITLFDLAVPYLPKVAIDNYILSFWHPVRGEQAPSLFADEFRRKYGLLVDPTEVSELGFISKARLKRIDLADLRRYREAGRGAAMVVLCLSRPHRVPGPGG